MAEGSYWKGALSGDVERLRAALPVGITPAPAWLQTGRTDGTSGVWPPFESWALRAGDALGQREIAATIALAVGAMTRGSPAGRLSRWAWAIPTLAAAAPAAAAQLRSQGWALAAGMSGETAGRDPAGSAPDTGGSQAMTGELRVLFCVSALVAGRDPSPWLAVADAAAPLVALLASFERLWLDPLAQRFDEARESGWLACALSAAPGPVLAALAGVHGSASRRAEVRSALAQKDVLQRVKERWTAGMVAAREALTGETVAVLGAFLDDLAKTFSYAESYLWMRSFTVVDSAAAAEPGRAVPWSWGEVALDVRRAVERVERDPSWSSSVDVQRWGVAPLAADLVGDWFPRGLVELALHETSGGREGSIQALLREIPPGELRYYRGFRGIPPDVDSLGLMLLLASLVPDPPLARLAGWLALVPENLGEDGVPTVWLRRSAEGPTHEPPDLVWAGDTCTACLLSLLLGLASFARSGLDAALSERCEALIPALVRRVLSCLDEEGFSGCHHYGRDFALVLFFRVAACLSDGEVHRRRDALAKRILAEQRLDGSWGSPQRTAWMVEALCLSSPSLGPLARAARYLAETQRGDGGWCPEMVYFTVGKPGFMVDYQGIEVTTAMCARALQVAHRAAKSAGGTSP